MSHYPMNMLRRLRGGGLIENVPLVLTETDFSGNAYLASDYEGSYLVDVKLKDLAMFFRVKKWKVTLTVDITNGGSADTYTSSTITTPSTVYEIARGEYDESDPTNVDWTGTPSSLYEVPDENYHELKKGDGAARSKPFRELRIEGTIAEEHFWDLTIKPMRTEQAYDYYMQTLPDLEAAVSVKPTTSVYLPISLVLNYTASVGALVTLQGYSKISDSNGDWDKADLTKAVGAGNLKFLGVDADFDIYWGEPTGEGITLDDLAVTIEAAEYWTYGGKFNSTTGHPV